MKSSYRPAVAVGRSIISHPTSEALAGWSGKKRGEEEKSSRAGVFVTSPSVGGQYRLGGQGRNEEKRKKVPELEEIKNGHVRSRTTTVTCKHENFLLEHAQQAASKRGGRQSGEKKFLPPEEKTSNAEDGVPAASKLLETFFFEKINALPPKKRVFLAENAVRTCWETGLVSVGSVWAQTRFFSRSVGASFFLLLGFFPDRPVCLLKLFQGRRCGEKAAAAAGKLPQWRRMEMKCQTVCGRDFYYSKNPPQWQIVCRSGKCVWRLSC